MCVYVPQDVRPNKKVNEIFSLSKRGKMSIVKNLGTVGHKWNTILIPNMFELCRWTSFRFTILI